jgi:hypothetical protein
MSKDGYVIKVRDVLNRFGAIYGYQVKVQIYTDGGSTVYIDTISNFLNNSFHEKLI